MADYPTSVHTFTARTDGVDTVVASDVNTAYSEVTSLETVIGTTPTAAVAWAGAVPTIPSGAFDHTTVKLRIVNAENAAFQAYTDRVKNTGGSTIQPSGTSTVNLILKGAASQTAKLLDIQSSAGTSLVSVTSAGAFSAVSIDGGSA